MKVTFLDPRCCKGFDGSDGARYWAVEQIRSFAYPKYHEHQAPIVSGICADEASHDFLRRRCPAAYCANELAASQTNALAYPTNLRFALRIMEENPCWQPVL